MEHKGTSRAAYATNNKYNFSGRTVLRKTAKTSSDLIEEPSIGWRMGAVDDEQSDRGEDEMKGRD